jgi:hypothetical protein
MKCGECMDWSRQAAGKSGDVRMLDETPCPLKCSVNSELCSSAASKFVKDRDGRTTKSDPDFPTGSMLPIGL